MGCMQSLCYRNPAAALVTSAEKKPQSEKAVTKSAPDERESRDKKNKLWQRIRSNATDWNVAKRHSSAAAASGQNSSSHSSSDREHEDSSSMSTQTKEVWLENGVFDLSGNTPYIPMSARKKIKEESSNETTTKTTTAPTPTTTAANATTIPIEKTNANTVTERSSANTSTVAIPETTTTAATPTPLPAATPKKINDGRPMNAKIAVPTSKKTPTMNAPQNGNLRNLEINCPLSTEAERQRFLNAKGGNYKLALQQLTAYLDWRSKYSVDSLLESRHGLWQDSEESDLKDWYLASSKALAYSSSNNRNAADLDSSLSSKKSRASGDSMSSSFLSKKVLPRLARVVRRSSHEEELLSLKDTFSSAQSSSSSFGIGGSINLTANEHEHEHEHEFNLEHNLEHEHKHESIARTASSPYLTDREGNRIIHLLPSQMDPNIADEETYTLCIAFYLELKLDRNDNEQIAVYIDIREGQGWHNPKTGAMIPFIKNVAGCLGTNFPERLSKCLIYPVPRMAMALWAVVKKFVDPNTSKKIVAIANESSGDKLSRSKSFMADLSNRSSKFSTLRRSLDSTSSDVITSFPPPPRKKLGKYVDEECIDEMEMYRIGSFVSLGKTQSDGALGRRMSTPPRLTVEKPSVLKDAGNDEVHC